MPAAIPQPPNQPVYQPGIQNGTTTNLSAACQQLTNGLFELSSQQQEAGFSVGMTTTPTTPTTPTTSLHTTPTKLGAPSLTANLGLFCGRLWYVGEGQVKEEGRVHHGEGGGSMSSNEQQGEGGWS